VARSVADELHAERLPSALRARALPDLLTLEGRRALVTGGAGKSLGRACVDRLASLGAQIALVDIDVPGAREAAAEIGDRRAATIVPLEGDVTDPGDVARFVEEARARLGGLDVVVHSAGGSKVPGRRSGPFLGESIEWIETMVRFNLLSAMYVVHAVLPGMLQQSSGHIVIVSSESGKVALPNMAAYSAAKAGVIGFVRAMGKEIGEGGVLINAVCPGIMLNDEVIEGLRKLPAEGATTAHMDGFSRVSMHRPCVPEEVANVVALLATDAASYVQGTAISVSGGMADW
jgi:NAD(P)-dependent dehydrogenase (short-subunit alcohol dehydrogenase family)